MNIGPYHSLQKIFSCNIRDSLCVPWYLRSHIFDYATNIIFKLSDIIPNVSLCAFCLYNVVAITGNKGTVRYLDYKLL